MNARLAGELHKFENAEALAQGAAEWICALAGAKKGSFTICLSGGSTPRRLYQILATPAFAARMPWASSHWFFGDERFVPHDHPDSNYHMAREALLAHVPIPPTQIHPVPTEGLSPQDAAVAYERTLKQHYGAETLDPRRPLFDVMLLGLGEDGHTASLIPGQPTLRERSRWVAAVIGARKEDRITLTYPVLDSSADVAFLVAGAGKREIFARVQAGDQELPALGVHPVGRLHWFVDRAALGG